MEITVDDIMEHYPDVIYYSREKIEELFGGKEYLTLMDISQLENQIISRIWIITLFLDDRTNRMFAADCVEHAAEKIKDRKLREIADELVKQMRRCANGEITVNDLAKHCYRYDDLYRTVNCAIEHVAYRAANLTAYRIAYFSAYNAIDWGVDWVKERHWQLERIKHYIRETEK